MINQLLAIDIPFFHYPFLGARVENYLWFAGIVLITFLLKRTASRFLALLISAVATRFTNGEYGRLFRGLIRKPLEWLIASCAFFAAFDYIDKPLNKVLIVRFHGKSGLVAVQLADLIDHLFIFSAILFTTLTLSRIIDFVYRTQKERANRTHQTDRAQLLPLVKDIVKMLLWSMAFFWMLGVVFHVNIPALITGLGIGGVAIALAAKETVENMFASLTILTDKPFLSGDIIRVSGLEGTVERIGFRSTKLRNSDGSLFIVPNKKLIDDNLENLTMRDTRRVQLTLNIKYGLSYDALQAMIVDIKGMIENAMHVVQPVEVTLEAFNEKVFQVLVTYHLPHPLIHTNLNSIKQDINLKTYEIIGKYNGTVTPTATPAANEEE